MYLVSEFQFLVSPLMLYRMHGMYGGLPSWRNPAKHPTSPHGSMAAATVQMRLCRGCAQGGVWWKRVGGRAGARQGRTAQNSRRMFVFAATLVPRRRDIRHGNVGERENFKIHGITVIHTTRVCVVCVTQFRDAWAPQF